MAHETSADWAIMELYGAESEKKAAQATQLAAQNQLVTDQKELAGEIAVKQAVALTSQTQALRRRIEQVAEETQRIVNQIPQAEQAGVNQAITEVIDGAFQKMQAEVDQVVKEARAAEGAKAAQAATNAQMAALPFQQAKLRSGQTMYSYASQAQELGFATATLKNKAMDISKQAAELQKQGNVVVAQQLAMQARDLMDKAQQYEGRAKAFHATANSIQGSLGAYDLSANDAAAYAAYVASPEGGAQPIQNPPNPLVLPPMPGAGAPGAGAPGPAPSPGPGPHPGPAPAPAR